jgi:eukaryotic-like serine/threonine-protein kinase
VVDDGSRILAGRYEVGELIGRGGMAEVHIGHDTRLGRTVAIKILRSDLARDPSFQNRFRREAQAAASLNHPAIVAVYDTGEDVTTEPTGVVGHVPFIVMEYVEGHTVRDILRDGHAVPIEEAVEITAGVLSALEYSHHAGIVHRDIKPANVMLTPTGAVKVMDFGIARAVADSAATMTQTQAVIGTAQYLSPEQARGETVDTRSDLYSTGCLLFELLTGRPPFVGDSPVSVAYQHVREAAPIPSSLASDVPDTLDRITLKALAKERDSRYSTAAEFRSELESALRGGVVAAPAVGLAVAAVAASDATQLLAPAIPVTQAVAATPPPWGTTGLSDVAPIPDEEEERKRPWLVWLLVAIAVLAVAGIAALLIANANKEAEPTMVTVPTLAGLTEEEANNELNALSLVPVHAEAPSDTVEEGLVIGTDPPAGKELVEQAKVTVTVSTGADSAQVPDVSGKTEEEAEALLKAEGLVLAATRENDNNPDFKEGLVTKTDPAKGETVDSGTPVTLYVSTGYVDVPSFVGKDQKEAVDTLGEKLNMRPTVKEIETTDKEPGTVVSQDRDGLLKQGTSITLEVAIAPTNASVPETIGMTYEDAVKAIKDAGITGTPTRVDEPSETVEAGRVLFTDPGANSQVELDQVIEIHVSSGPPTPTSEPTVDPTVDPGAGDGTNP